MLKKYIGKRRVADCLTRSGREIAKSLTIPTTILYGGKEIVEYPKLKTRTDETQKLAKNVQVIVVKDAPHDISFPTYQTAIEKMF